MSEKEGNDVAITEKSEEMGETLTNEDTPASLETIPSETPLVRNGVQVASKDRAKSKRLAICRGDIILNLNLTSSELVQNNYLIDI